MNKPVNFDIAKLLKEKGFDKYCNSGYTETGDKYLHQGGQELVCNNESYYEGRYYTGGKFYCSAPTIAEVVMWLYEKHGIWISVDFKETDESFQYCCRLIHSDNLPRIFCNDNYNSPTEAYEAALLYTLKNLI